MENTGLKGLFVTLYQRVIVSYKTTFLGFAVIAASAVAENFVHSPNKTLGTIGLVLGSVLALVKEAKPSVVLPPPAP